MVDVSHSHPVLAFEAPECLNRLWFVGRLLTSSAPDGDHFVPEQEKFFGALARAALRDVDSDVGRSALVQWRQLWASAIRRRMDEVIVNGPALPARLDIPEEMHSLSVVEAVAEDMFRGWWAPPVGVKPALLWLIGQVSGQLDTAGLIRARRSDVAHVDVVGYDHDCTRDHGYVKVGAGALFPPKTSTLVPIFGAP